MSADPMDVLMYVADPEARAWAVAALLRHGFVDAAQIERDLRPLAARGSS